MLKLAKISSNLLLARVTLNDEIILYAINIFLWKIRSLFLLQGISYIKRLELKRKIIIYCSVFTTTKLNECNADLLKPFRILGYENLN